MRREKGKSFVMLTSCHSHSFSPPFPQKRNRKLKKKKRKYYSLVSKKEKQKELKKVFGHRVRARFWAVCGKTHFLGLCWFDVTETKTNIQSISLSFLFLFFFLSLSLFSLTNMHNFFFLPQLIKTTKCCRTAHFSTM